MQQKLATLCLTAGLVLSALTAQAQVTSITPTGFTGSRNGDAYTGNHNDFAPFDNLAGASTIYNDPAFTPPLPTSQAIGYFSQNGFSIPFASPVTNPVIDVYSLVNTLDFGTPVILLSNGGVAGSSQVALQLTGNGHGIIGQSANGGFDAGGTIELPGTFSTITATPLTFSSDGSAILRVPAATPKPGSIAMLGSLTLTGGLFMIRKRRVRK